MVWFKMARLSGSCKKSSLTLEKDAGWKLRQISEEDEDEDLGVSLAEPDNIEAWTSSNVSALFEGGDVSDVSTELGGAGGSCGLFGVRGSLPHGG